MACRAPPRRLCTVPTPIEHVSCVSAHIHTRSTRNSRARVATRRICRAAARGGRVRRGARRRAGSALCEPGMRGWDACKGYGCYGARHWVYLPTP
eukprot:6241043-Prymnesium_polylepis.1